MASHFVEVKGHGAGEAEKSPKRHKGERVERKQIPNQCQAESGGGKKNKGGVGHDTPVTPMGGASGQPKAG